MCGAIRAKFLALGGPGGLLGYPTTDETPTPDGVGRFNHFANDGSIYWTPNTGAWSIHGAIQDKWASLGWERSFLGYPVTDETVTPDGIGRFNHFSSTGRFGASVYWTPSTRAWSIHGLIRDKWASLGWERSPEGYLVSDEFAVPNGRQSNFQNGHITYDFASGQTSASFQPVCSAPTPSPIATKLSADIRSALNSRVSTAAIAVFDRTSGVTCGVSPNQQFDSASIVKVTIVGTLLRMAMDEHRALTAQENQRATAMIEHSDNNATDAVWAEVGRVRFQQFLNLVGMTDTVPGPGGFWGLTQATPDNEMKLLLMLTSNTTVLDAASRAYELNLMANVEPDQRWGVSAGTPAGVTVHLKNGWLPRATHGWRINSIGTFSGSGRDYAIAVLSEDNPTMAYGVATVERAAQAINRDLNPTNNGAVVPATRPSVAWEIPDEQVPDMPGVP